MAAKLPNYSSDSQLSGIVLLVDASGNPLLVTGRSLANAKTIDVSIVDASGNQITSFGGGVGGTGMSDAEFTAHLPLGVTDNGGSLTVDGTFFQATQPVSAVALPLPAGASTSALQTQPGVDIGDVTINNAGGAAAVNVQDGGNSLTVDGVFFLATQPVSAVALPLPSGASTSALQTQPGVDIGDVTINNAAGAAAVNVQDGGNSLTVDGAISFTAPQHVIVDSGGGGGTQYLNGTGGITNGTGTLVIGIDSGGVARQLTLDAAGIPFVNGRHLNNFDTVASSSGLLALGGVTEATPVYTDTASAASSLDLRGVTRQSILPMAVAGAYKWQGMTVTHTGLAANAPLWSMRWTNATRFAVILRVAVMVFTSTAATVASITERQLVIARAFTVVDTGGVAAVLTGNNNKMRTNMATSVLGDMRIGALTAGTRTLDAAPVSTAIGWSGLLSTGIVIGGFGSSPVGAARSTEGGAAPVDLLNVLNGQDYPIILTSNEGLVVRMGAVQPTTSVQQTVVMVQWLEANKVF